MQIMDDTSDDAEKILINGYRAMPAWKKIRQVSSFTKTVQQMALARIKKKYGHINEREIRLRLASLWLPRETMIRLFSWDPMSEGY
jgi:hypothetical protein